MSSNTATLERANRERAIKKTSEPRQRANHYLKPRDQPSHLPPRHVEPAVEDVACDLCGSVDDLIFERSLSRLAVICADCESVIADELYGGDQFVLVEPTWTEELDDDSET